MAADRERDGARLQVGNQWGEGTAAAGAGIVGQPRRRGNKKGREGGRSGLGRVEFGVTRWQILVNTSKPTRHLVI
jgi:hypothetical protein